MLRPPFIPLFVIAETSQEIKGLLRKCDISYVTLPDSHSDTDFLEMISTSDVVVLDGYHFEEALQRSIKNIGCSLVVIDDKAEKYFYADIIINHGGERLRTCYKTQPDTKLLLGFPYLLVRAEFQAAAKKSRSIQTVDTAFICMGGADPFKITLKALQACSNVMFLKKVFVVTGSAYTATQELRTMISQISSVEVIHEQDVSSGTIVSLLEQSQIAICPSSSIALEAICVKTGLLSGTFIENQEELHHQLTAHHCCISAGDFNSVTVEQLTKQLHSLGCLQKITELIHNQAMAVDGNSAQRIFDEVIKLK